MNILTQGQFYKDKHILLENNHLVKNTAEANTKTTHFSTAIANCQAKFCSFCTTQKNQIKSKLFLTVVQSFKVLQSMMS